MTPISLPDAITLSLFDGVRVVVPDSLNLITSYVLREQLDWFEDEIKFLRRLLQPGQKVIDIGANYGVYALSMANKVGPSGHVWAFEPATSTAEFLAAGIAANRFSQVTLERSALSNARGSARLSLNQNSELNALVRGPSAGDASEAVPLVTLDDRLEAYGWRDIEFVKIDAEGEESNILKGGKRFFTELSPLIEYEIKAGAEVHMELVSAFDRMGYQSYRLVPGLDLLVPFDLAATTDAYLLNLFCCKPDRAARLATQGFLVNSSEPHREGPCEHDWRSRLCALPYGRQLAHQWEQTVTESEASEVEEALSCYCASQDVSLTMAERFHALEDSFDLLQALCEREPAFLRQSSLARVARDYGARAVAVEALQKLANTIFERGGVDLREPFLTPGERFDSVPPGSEIWNWAVAGVVEELEKLAAFSSFYTGASALQRLEVIRDLHFGSDEMQRRLQLVQQRFGAPST